MFKTDSQILEDLRCTCIGKMFDSNMYNDIICAFESENEVIVNESCNNGYEIIAYENTKYSSCFCFNANKKGIITDIFCVE